MPAIVNQMRQIVSKMSTNSHQLRDMIELRSIGGKAIAFTISIIHLWCPQREFPSGDSRVLFQAFLWGASENQNATMMAAYDVLEHYAAQ